MIRLTGEQGYRPAVRSGHGNGSNKFDSGPGTAAPEPTRLAISRHSELGALSAIIRRFS